MAFETEGKHSSILPLSVIVLVLGLGGIYLYDQPFSSFRPETQGVAGGHDRSIEEIDARLWEDPFRAIDRAVAPSPCTDWSFVLREERGVTGAHSAKTQARERQTFLQFQQTASRQLLQLAYDARRKSLATARSPEVPPIVLLPVLVPGDPYFEQAEKRRRTRYAVLAALAAAGYVPERSEQIGLVDTCWDFSGRLAPTAGRPVPVPYEWLEPDPFRPPRGAASASAVLVLWLDESEFGVDPWVRIDDLLGHVVGYCEPYPSRDGCLDPEESSHRFAFRLIGPASSGTLAGMVSSQWRPPERTWRDTPTPVATGATSTPMTVDDRLAAVLQLTRSYLDRPTDLLGARGERREELRQVLGGEVERVHSVIEEIRKEPQSQSAALRAGRIEKALTRLPSLLRELDPSVRDSDLDWPESVSALWGGLLAAELRGEEPFREIVKPIERLCRDLAVGRDPDGDDPVQDAVSPRATSPAAGSRSNDTAGPEPDACRAAVVIATGFRGERQEAGATGLSLPDRLALRLLRHHLKADPQISLSERAGHLAAALRDEVYDWRRGGNQLAVPLEEVPERVALWVVKHRHEVLGETRAPGSVVPRLRVYNQRATAPPALLLNAAGAEGRAMGQRGAMRALSDAIRDAAGAGDPRIARTDFRFVPVIHHDDELAPVLVEELARRRIDLCEDEGKHHVALVGEWDTLYGRALPLTFEAAVLRCREEDGVPPGLDRQLLALTDGRVDPPARIERYHYLRGLDGIAPTSGGDPNERDGGGPRDGSAPSSRRQGVADWLPWQSAKHLERPRGNPQFDYMRRLADQLARRGDQIRERGGELRAIGIVGTDTYDKMLVLQALRTRFPRTLFFTTDLDVRMLHPADRRWNRNLVVASSFGLRLHPDLQPNTPPFRDSYQAATFLAVRLAMAGSAAEAAGATARPLPQRSRDLRSISVIVPGPEPRRPLPERRLADLHESLERSGERPRSRLFEVARSGPLELSRPAAAAPRTVASVHPEAESRPVSVTAALRMGGATVLGVLLLIPLAPSLRRVTIGRWGELAPRDRFAFDGFVTLVAATGLLYLWLVVRGAWRAGGEPFELWQGISLWPTEALRLAAALLALFFVGFGTVRLRENADELNERYALRVGPRRETPGCWRRWWTARRSAERGSAVRSWLSGFATSGSTGFRALASHVSSWPRSERAALWRERERVSINAWRCLRGRETSRSGEPVDPEVQGDDAWDRYLYLGRFGHRMTRILPIVALYFLFGYTVILLLGEPHVPFRDSFSYWVDFWVLKVSVVLMVLLTFFVVDATRLCERWIEILAERPIRWSPEAIATITSRRRIEARDAGDVLDLELIADRTEVVGNLILYPFAVLFLMIVSRAPVFDNWDWPPGLILVLGLSSAYALACGVVLRRAAERARRRTLDHLRENLYDAFAEEEREDGPRGASLRLLIEEVQELRRGAFAHWTHHPLVKAVLLPFSGVGLIALVELLSVLGR